MQTPVLPNLPEGIRPATMDDSALLARLATQTFIESHGHSAPPADIEAYATKFYTPEALMAALTNPANHYYLIYAGQEIAGFSNLVLDTAVPGTDQDAPFAKLDRIYVLRAFHDQKLGAALMDFNIQLARAHQQKGLWLYTWVKNERAIRFYERYGFRVEGHHDFRISPTHTNPNHLMTLRF